jgi:hypothetical protein
MVRFSNQQCNVCTGHGLDTDRSTGGLICRNKLRNVKEDQSYSESHRSRLATVPDDIRKQTIECIERVEKAEKKAEEERSELLTERRKKQSLM